jgi:hypothetical protein
LYCFLENKNYDISYTNMTKSCNINSIDQSLENEFINIKNKNLSPYKL